MIHIPKGTKDVLPNESYKWHYIESTIRGIASLYNLKEIRTPVFEATELFSRGVGETSDIVNKEMYTFLDKGNRSMTLKPEGTAGVARSVIENSLYMNILPIKMYYITPVFRYEKPQSGRLREHHQFGVELYGADTAEADVEVISIAKALLDKLSISNLTLYINSIGCIDCRVKYNNALKDYLKKNIDNMCDLCRDRLNINPLRILDCKNEACIVVNSSSPIIQDYLCEECLEHQSRLKNMLTVLGIEYTVNPRIVRGLDYYTKTVFEFVSNNIGAQGTVCGGGRYNDLVSEIGGKYCPAIGFGMGIERLIMVMENAKISLSQEVRPDLYIAPIDANIDYCLKLSDNLRKQGLIVDIDLMARSLNAQLKYANKINARYLAVIGGDEINSGSIRLKEMDTGAESVAYENEIYNIIRGE